VPTEQEILNVIRKVVPNSKRYLFDDAAIIACPRQVRLRRKKNLIVTTDTLVENTHFTLKTSTPEEIGWKAMAVNLSDIAAMGGTPLYALVSLSLPEKFVRVGLAPTPLLPWIKSLYKGIVDCTKKYKTQIIGGNLARSKEISITITVIGKSVVKAGFKPASTRSNARPGDRVFTTGTFGDAAAGYLLMSNVEACHGMPLRKKLINSHKTPIPQISLGQKIVGTCLKRAPALMDASDGLADCLIQISNQSNVKIIIDENKIPISSNTKKASQILNRNPVNLALYGGEDYQLVGTASEIDCKRLRKIKGIKLIGKVIKGKGAYLKQNTNKLVKLDLKKTYEHFS